ncbi:MAG: FeoB-associated Cys-rich membrane protein [Sphingobacteriaceae bacterium]|nr:MAG: FeoB-associated Cys-rich membrane protein [Sphingobacteriaceae bacterium]
MDIQAIIVAILVIAAAVYLFRKLYISLTAKNGCGTNCKCGVDFSNVAPEIRK